MDETGDPERLLRETVSDARRFVQAEGRRARVGAADVARRLLVPGVALAGGLALVLSGAGMLAARPAVPSRERTMRRRLRWVALGYLAGGGVLLLLSAPAITAELLGALGRAGESVRTSLDAASAEATHP